MTVKEHKVNYNLICRLSRSAVGCFIGADTVVVLAFAVDDDIVLIGPTSSAMHKLLSIYDCFATEYDVRFNAQ